MPYSFDYVLLFLCIPPLQRKYSIHGRDKAGRVVIIIFERNMGKHTYTDLNECTAALVFGLELLAQRVLGPMERFTVIFNRVGATKANIDLDWAKVVGQVLQNNYPERLAKAYVVPANFLFRGVRFIVIPYFSPRGRSLTIFLISLPKPPWICCWPPRITALANRAHVFRSENSGQGRTPRRARGSNQVY